MGPATSRLEAVDYRLVNGRLIGTASTPIVQPLRDLRIYAPLDGNQVTDSENHVFWNRRRDFSQPGKFQGDLGGIFTSRRRWATIEPNGPMTLIGDKRTQLGEGSVCKYTGPFLPIGPGIFQWPPYGDSSEDALNVAGAVAISRCSPTNSSSDLAAFLFELLKEGIPSLVGETLLRLRGMTHRQRSRAAGKEYLNSEFGWKPMVRDILKLCESIVDADTVLEQYSRNSGKLVRRRYEFPTSHSSSSSYWVSDTSPWVNPSTSGLTNRNTNQGRIVREISVTQRRWFSGAFSYYVPPSDTARNSMARSILQAKHLLGIMPTPEVVWEVTPWSWLVDWFFNVQDVIHNWTSWAFDNQVLMYGYVMEHTYSTYKYTFVGETGFLSGARPPVVTLHAEVKLRRRASPYGFGKSWSSFSARQLAILAALGLSNRK